MINRLLSRFHWHRIWPRRRANPYAIYLQDLKAYRDSHSARIRELEAELYATYLKEQRAYRDSHSARIRELEAELAALRALVRERQP